MIEVNSAIAAYQEIQARTGLTGEGAAMLVQAAAIEDLATAVYRGLGCEDPHNGYTWLEGIGVALAGEGLASPIGEGMKP